MRVQITNFRIRKNTIKKNSLKKARLLACFLFLNSLLKLIPSKNKETIETFLFLTHNTISRVK